LSILERLIEAVGYPHNQKIKKRDRRGRKELRLTVILLGKRLPQQHPPFSHTTIASVILLHDFIRISYQAPETKGGTQKTRWVFVTEVASGPYLLTTTGAFSSPPPAGRNAGLVKKGKNLGIRMAKRGLKGGGRIMCTLVPPLLGPFTAGKKAELGGIQRNPSPCPTLYQRQVCDQRRTPGRHQRKTVTDRANQPITGVLEPERNRSNHGGKPTF